jgi:hypothetical protein
MLTVNTVFCSYKMLGCCTSEVDEAKEGEGEGEGGDDVGGSYSDGRKVGRQDGGARFGWGLFVGVAPALHFHLGARLASERRDYYRLELPMREVL